MTIEEIKNICIQSAKNYYRYLDKARKATEKINVRKIEKRDDNNYILKLSKKIYDTDYIDIEMMGFICDKADYYILEYDHNNNMLYIRVNDEFAKKLDKVDIDKFFVISDLKYLVKRVEKWYGTFGKAIHFEREIPLIPRPTAAPDGMGFSDEQKRALKTIFESEVSYIWGAPGTGKTKYVLANAILTYINNDERILVVAPTNNSLEQSLYGILDVLDTLKIPHEKILRLGVPSKEFATKYPDCCEIDGLDKKIHELESQKRIYKKKLDCLKAVENYKYMKETICKFAEHARKLSEEYSSIERELEPKQIRILKISKLVHSLKTEKNNYTNQLINIKRNINTRKTKDSVYRDLAINKKKSSMNVLLIKIKKLDNIISQNVAEIDILKSDIEKDKEKQTKITLQWNKEKDTVHDRKLYNIINADISDIKTIEQETKKLNEEKQYLYSTIEGTNFLYNHETEEELRKKIKAIQSNLDKIYEKTIKQRIKNVRVMAMTVDTFINKIDFTEPQSPKLMGSPFEIRHVFLDESGYCSLIKGCTLFAFSCPITMLGDHMQLPPVCEMNDEEMERKENSDICLWAQSAIAVESMFKNSFNEIYSAYMNGNNITFSTVVKTDLTETFRFGNKVSKILDNKVYCNGFHSSVKAENSNVIILSVIEKAGEKSKRENMEEGKAIREWLKRKKLKDYAILTPYTNQVKLLGELMPEERNKQNIMTVHASQGKEWETVILSVSDTSNKWFTDSKNPVSRGKLLINTAVSRARKNLIIVCNSEYWEKEQDQLIGELVRNADWTFHLMKTKESKYCFYDKTTKRAILPKQN